MSERVPYAWVDRQTRALRRSRRMIAGLAVADALIVAWNVWAIYRGARWWLATLTVFAVSASLAQAVRAHLRWARVHDLSLLSRERYRMGLPPDD